MLFAEAVERGVGFDGGRVHGLRVARHQPHRHALGKDVVEQVLEDDRGIQLVGATDSGVPGQVLVDLVAQKIEDVEPQGAVLDQAAVAGDVFQPAHEHELEEDDRVELGLSGVTVYGAGLLTQKLPV